MSRYLIPLWLGLIAMPAALHATHIVGGEIGYKCLGNNQYEVTLSVYRDCYNGAPDAPFDDPAYVSIYNQFQFLVTTLELPFIGDDTISTVLTDPCLVVLSPVCVHTTTYRDTVTLPFIAGGYTFTYQRCCRNMTILNIIDPLQVGATYDIKLTEESMLNCNSSPKFKQWPPIYICTSRPLVFDHSAIDSDGDSLVYKLCTPKDGGTFSNPQPIPPDPPPYDTIVWKAPTYSLSNVLGFGTPLQINPVTGVMTAVPGVTGQYVVGVCVEEYDRETGIKLSVTRRDFQYNVNPCGEVTAAIGSPDAQCDNLTVNFQNQSSNATSYQWYFDYPNPTPGTTSNAPTVTNTYPDTGTYKITLIAEPNSQCADTAMTQVYLQFNSLTADFQADVFDCQTESLVQITDLSVDPVSPPNHWSWVLTYGNVTLTSNLQNPIFSVPLGVTGTITLTVMSVNGCESTESKPFQSGLDNPAGLFRDTIRACIGDVVGLNPDTPPGISFSYIWSPGAGLSDSTAVNPTVTVTGNADYSVTVTPSNNICQIIKIVHVEAVQLPSLSFTTTPACDGLTLNFDNTSLNANTFFWDFGDTGSDLDTSSLVAPSYTYPDTGTYVVTLIGSVDGYCVDTLTQSVTVLEALLNPDFSVTYLACTPDSIVAQFNDLSTNSMNNTTGWLWELGNGQTSNEQNPVFVFTENQTMQVSLTITTALDCSSTRTKVIDIVLLTDTDQFPDTLIVCPGDTVQLTPGGDTTLLYHWSPSTGLSDSTSASPLFFPTVTTLYTVTVSTPGADTCQVEEQILVLVPPVINLHLNTTDTISCESELVLTATTDVPAVVIWYDHLGNPIDTSAEITVQVSGNEVYTAVATDPTGCSESVSTSVSGGPIDVSIPDTIAICLGDSLIIPVINSDPNDTLSYVWSPSSLFVPGTETQAIPDFIETPGEHEVYVQITNQFGCVYNDTILVAVVDTAMQLSFTYEVQCDGATVAFTNTSTNAFGYIWYFGDNTTSTAINPIHTYSQAGTYDVILTIIYDVPCTDTATAQVTVVEPQIVAGFDYDIVECTQDSIVVAFFDNSINTFNNTVGWHWVFSSGQESMEQNPLITFTESGQVLVTLTITSANDCSDSVTDTLDIQIVTIDLPDTLIVCLGDSAVLNPSGNPDFMYKWSPATGLSDSTAVSPTVTPTETTVYTVMVSSIIGMDTCTITDSVVVFVPPTINVGYEPVVITCGEDATLTVTGDSTIASIIWTNLNMDTLGTGPTLVVNPDGTGLFIANITDIYGCMVCDTITVINHGIDVSIDPQTDTLVLCQGIDTTITITNLDPTDTLTYQWFPPDIIIGPTDSSSVTVILTTDTTATLTGVVTNQYGCSDTIVIVLTTIPFDPNLQDTILVCYGEPLPLNPNGNPDYIYHWFPTEGLSDPNANNPIFIGTESMDYIVTVIDTTGGVNCEIEVPVTVLVSDPINLTVTPGDTAVCSLDSLTLTAGSTLPGVIFTWYNTNGDSIGQGSSIEVVPMEGNNTYTVVATDSLGCSDTLQVNISAVDFNPNLDTLVIVCGNTPTPINPNGNPNYVYIWDPTTGLDLTTPWNPIATLQQSMTYNVTVTDPLTGCTYEGTVVVQVPPLLNLQTTGDTVLCEITEITLTATTDVPATIEWFKNPNLTPPADMTGNTYTVMPLEGTNTYYVLATDMETMCQDTNTVTIIVHDIANALPLDYIDGCANIPIPLNPQGDSSLIYVWTPADSLDLTDPWNPVVTLTDTMIFYVSVTDPIFGCTVMDTVQVNIGPAINLVTAGDTTLCQPATIPLTATSDRLDAILTWYSNPELTVEIGQGSPIQVTPQGAHTYYVVAIDSLGCSEIDSVLVNAFPIQAVITAPLVLCEPTDDVNLAVTNLDPTQVLTFVWSPAGAILSPIDGPMVTVDPNEATDFSVALTNQYGCMDTLSTSVTIIDLSHTLSIDAVPDTILLGNSSVITVLGDCIGCIYQWQVPSGTISPNNGGVVTATPDEVGENIYTVTVNQDICTTDLSVSVFVINAICDDDHVFLPNAFTPNGDGENDILRIRSAFLNQLTDVELLIYNRWGEEMFRTSNPFDSWNGTYKGEKLPPDVYGYYLHVVCPNEQELIQKGNVTLIR